MYAGFDLAFSVIEVKWNVCPHQLEVDALRWLQAGMVYFETLTVHILFLCVCAPLIGLSLVPTLWVFYLQNEK